MRSRDALLRNTHRMLKMTRYTQDFEMAHAAALVQAYEQDLRCQRRSGVEVEELVA